MRLDETDLLKANKINVFGTAQGLFNIDLEKISITQNGFTS